MAGLLNAAAQMAGMQAGAQEQDDDQEEESLTPKLSEEDEQRRGEVVNQAMSLIYDKSAFDKALKMIGATLRDDPPFKGLSTLIAQTLFKLKVDASRSKVELSDDVMLQAAADLVEDLATTAVRAGVYPRDFPQGYIDGAYVRAVDEYRTLLQKSNMLDVEKQKQIWANMQQASRDGSLPNRLGFNRKTRRALGV